MLEIVDHILVGCSVFDNIQDADMDATAMRDAERY